ncbi:hypothetical protein K4L44_04955 [Halosquirtibacter laminarini]|uniref:Uncharacterized protein n=1 Tax=Halosquirtibacter laminarini TaxID=3374600 RepID=A0AC61NPA3_9BACT|nr:hypothetical protein K4L44_04955 [Prolixibacteraceae bacterium]
MRYLFCLCVALCSMGSVVLGQAKKPTIMVVPSDAWCAQHGFMLNFDNQGSEMRIPDYERAFQESPNLLLVVSTLNGLMADRGFPLKNMESVLKSLKQQHAEEMMIQSKETGAEMMESPIDALKKVAKADILMQVTWTVNTTGPKKSVTFNIQGLNSYTNKQVATATGTGAPSMNSSLPILIEEAVNSKIDGYCHRLQDYFGDLFENGREVNIHVRTWSDWGQDLESEFGDDELSFVIEDWMQQHSVKGRFNTTDVTESMMTFEQVRIPMYYERKGRKVAMDTRRFVRGLTKFLKNAPYHIPSKVVTKGLGEVTIYLGGK